MKMHEYYIIHVPEKANEALKRSLQSLAKHKHIQVITNFAKTEYELGSLENARRVFENLISTYPKRTDLWNIYIDKEIKNSQDMSYARRLLERMSSIKFSPSKMKLIFKRFLKFEEDHGDEETLEAAKALVTNYVNSQL